MNFIVRLDNDLNKWPEPILSVLLIVIGVTLIALALLPGKGLLKALVLAWVLLP